jgi:hypothetical protein
MSGRGHFSGWELMVILALRRLGGDAYGVPICSEIEEQTGHEVQLEAYMPRWTVSWKRASSLLS